MEHASSKLTPERKIALIEAMRQKTLAGFEGETSYVEVSMTPETADRWGWTDEDHKHLYRKEGCSGLYFGNNNCPKATSPEDGLRILALMGKNDPLKVIQGEITRLWGNDVRKVLTAPESKKQAVEAQKRATAAEYKAMMDAGDLTPEELFEKMQALI